jgi:Outer membrane protein beta-barrel domain
MSNGGANIDLLFRNGLKDFEVLPPVGVWAKIFPAIRRKQRPFVLLRYAAVIVVILSVSLLAYKWSNEVTITLQNQNNVLAGEAVKTDNGGTVARFSPIKAKRTSKGIVNGTNELKPVADVIPTEPAQAQSGNFPQEEYLSNKSTFRPDWNLNFKSSLNRVLKSDYQSTGSKSDTYNILKELPYQQSKDKTGRWSLTALVSPTYYLRPELDNSSVSKQINSSEQSRISYSGGVSFAYRISRKLSIQSGLYYSSIGNEINGISSFSGFHSYDYTKGDHNFEVLTSDGLIYTNNADVFLIDNTGNRVQTIYTRDVFDPSKANLSYVDNTLYQNFSYLEMPVFLRYKLIDRTIDFNVIGGLSYNLLVNNTVNAHVSGNSYSVGKTAGLNPFMVTSSFGMGMEYNISDKFSLNLEPTFRYYLNPFSVIQGPRTHPYSFGIFSGISYKF